MQARAAARQHAVHQRRQRVEAGIAVFIGLEPEAAAHPADAWAKVLVPSLEAFAKTAKDLKVTDKGVTADELLSVSTGFTSVIEANERALSRSLVAKGQTNEAARPAAAAPAASAAPTAKP